VSVGVRAIEPGSFAERLGIRAGDRLVAINNHPIEDELDARFYSSASRVRVRWERAGKAMEAGGRVRPGEPPGWDLEPFKPRRCNNRCIFCFILQLPRGLRKSLYFRDEDFRLSFLYGNYITGTNLSEHDLRRIARQKLSPLYISVHTTDPDLRARMLGRRRLEPITHLLDHLASNGIEFHAQIVVCPGWNDGAALKKTLADLHRYYPALRSVAIVPVGLTSHREGLPRLRPVTPRYAERTIAEIEPIARRWRRETGERVLFLADEWYLRAGRPAPAYTGLDLAPQFENGVGMVAHFLRPWRTVEKRLPEEISPARSVGVITGVLAAPVLRPLIARLNRIKGLRADLIVARNRLFGPTVTVTGLLAGKDIGEAILSRRRRADFYLLPANSLRPWDRRFLDDLLLDKLEREVGKPTVAVEGTCRDLVRAALAAENPKAA